MIDIRHHSLNGGVGLDGNTDLHVSRLDLIDEFLDLICTQINREGKGIPVASIWKMNCSTPALAMGATYFSGFSTMRWQSKNPLEHKGQVRIEYLVCLRRH